MLIDQKVNEKRPANSLYGFYTIKVAHLIVPATTKGVTAVSGLNNASAKEALSEQRKNDQTIFKFI